jgi:hypothetical protein
MSLSFFRTIKLFFRRFEGYDLFNDIYKIGSPASLFKKLLDRKPFQKGLSENPWHRRDQAARLLTLTFLV